MFRIRLIFLIVMIFAFAVAGMPAAAQEGREGPAQVGLRPDAPTYALHGPYWVGVTEYVAETDFHPTRVTVWYPAENANGDAEAVTYRLDYWPPSGQTIAGHALLDATPYAAGGPFPLVVFSHGFEGSPLNSATLCEHLASHGFVVVGILYQDHLGARPSPPLGVPYYTRPQDTRWALDYATSLTGPDGTLTGMIDTSRVAVIGYSFGGFASLAAAGARLDLRTIDDVCATYPDVAWMCLIDQQNLAGVAGLDEAPDGLWPSWGDSRVHAIVNVSPWLLGLTPDSMSELTVPVMTLVGSADQSAIQEYESYKDLIYTSLASESKSLVVLENGQHYLVGETCASYPPSVATSLFAFCSDPVWDMDRAHDLINHFTTAFLLDALKGDAEAHAALLPDAVSFPGITYETTMH